MNTGQVVVKKNVSMFYYQ